LFQLSKLIKSYSLLQINSGALDQPQPLGLNGKKMSFQQPYTLFSLYV